MKMKIQAGTKQRMREELERKEGCMYLSTGAGKSMLAAKIVEQIGRKSRATNGA